MVIERAFIGGYVAHEAKVLFNYGLEAPVSYWNITYIIIGRVQNIFNVDGVLTLLVN